MIPRQTWALTVEAYRELSAKKLFWITLGLSGLVVLIFAAIGVGDNGMTIFTWELEIPGLNRETVPPEQFYKLAFTQFGIGVWLTWIAAILALVSTAGIVPDMISGGSIDLLLSKPISRARLFLTKYAIGLMFVVLQVGVFSLASFLVIGFRGGAWEPGFFLAVPVVTLFFSFLFCVCALAGLLTRSTIASLLITLLFWFLVFISNIADAVLTRQTLRYELEIERRTELIADTDERIERLGARIGELRASPEADAEETLEEIATLEERLERGGEYRTRVEEQLETSQGRFEAWSPWQRSVFGLKTALPKTGETINLLTRWLVDLANLEEVQFGDQADEPVSGDSDFGAMLAAADESGPSRGLVSEQEVDREFQRLMNERSVAWILGTSVAFEVFILGICLWIFGRRDF